MNNCHKKNSDDSKTAKSGKKIITLLFFIVLIMFFVFGIPLLINETYKIGSGYVTCWNAADVLTYYSVILSGIISIGSLATTILYSKKDTEKQIKAAKAQFEPPFFVVNKILYGGVEISPDTNKKQSWSYEYPITHRKEEIIIQLKNIGNGIAITSYYINIESKNKNYIQEYILKDGTLEINYDLISTMDIRSDNSNKYNNNITICYQNIAGIAMKQSIPLQMNIKRDRNRAEIVINNTSVQEIEM